MPMTMPRTRSLIALLILVCALTGVATASAKIRRQDVGIADNKPAFFSDQRFLDLKLKRARINIPWDILKDGDQTAVLDTWMNAAKTAGVKPLVTFDRSRRPGQVRVRPTPAKLVAQFKAIRARYPFIEGVVTWNEPNLFQTPELTAKQWMALRKACPKCKVLAGDMVDRANVNHFVARFLKTVKKAHKKRPTIWGFHNYADVNRFEKKITKSFVKATKADVWLTETGGVVSRRNGSPVKYKGTGPKHAAKAIKYLFDKLVKVSPRIKRVYLFHWDGVGPGWDSGFIDKNGNARPALSTL